MKGSVVHITSAHSPYDIRIFHKECLSLAKAGYQVTLIAPHDHDELNQGVRVVSLPKLKGRARQMSATVMTAYRKALEIQADIYHFHDPALIPAGLLLRLHGKKVIYDIHEDTPRALFSRSRDYIPNYAKPSVSSAFEHFENFASARFTGLVAATPAIGRRFQGINSQTRVINNFPVMEELQTSSHNSWRNRSMNVAYIGLLTLERGVEQMIEAIGLVSQQLKVRLKLAGNPEIFQNYKNLTQLPGWKQVDLLGFLKRSEVADLLGQVCAGLVLFHPDPNHIEAQPNKLFEYMSAGLPVIASDFPVWREIVDKIDCGLLVDPLDPKAIGKAIEFITTHPTEAEEMGRRGRIAIGERYNWAVEENKLLKFYADLLTH